MLPEKSPALSSRHLLAAAGGAALDDDGTAHWWVGALDAPTPAGLLEAPVVPVLPGGADLGLEDPCCAAGPGGGTPAVRA